ncbi:MAG: hypothetical protein M3Q14_04835 [bacterium]|nr:hypothetical protein [bacterium]
MQDGQQSNEPGWVFRPGDQTPPPLVTPTVAPAPPAPVLPAAPPPPSPVVSGEFGIPQGASPSLEPRPTSIPVPATKVVESAPEQSQDEAHAEWTASEYIATPKNSGWFALLAIVSILLAAIVYVVTRDMISTIVTLILGAMMGIFAARQPRTLQYRIDNHGIYIGERFFSYDSFKSFSIAREQAMGFISLMPLKRFMPPLSIHYEPQDEDHIANTLADYLPYEEHKADLVDNLSRKFRF